MAKQFKVTRKDGLEHIVPEAALGAIKRMYVDEGKDLVIEEINNKVAAEKPVKDKVAAEK